ncbi:uncharacterized protein LAJ45_09361 [Morchella importuna]|uniref:uncharacterized protein n=1 Tax=Morchella importuna TaxID=1174673 RepID=UPI001E8ECCDE|nr:uncharacterized protein LAJ45_09361 [Morchella importuna]KAH8146678.1 hypothetical protein LAJ45_09361 [Morchella importuna]
MLSVKVLNQHCYSPASSSSQYVPRVSNPNASPPRTTHANPSRTVINTRSGVLGGSTALLQCHCPASVLLLCCLGTAIVSAIYLLSVPITSSSSRLLP